jgi:predicted aconitase with swiveling domain
MSPVIVTALREALGGLLRRGGGTALPDVDYPSLSSTGRLVFPHGKGSTVGSYVMLQLAKNKKVVTSWPVNDTLLVTNARGTGGLKGRFL